MRYTLLLIALLASALTGCAGGNPNRPCGPGYLGNVLVPQRFLDVDFRDACHGHDACYACPGSDQKSCDVQFLNDMNCACRCSSHPTVCRLRAKQWYWQVRLFGGSGFRKAQRGNNCCK